MNLSDDVFGRVWQALGLAGRPRTGGGNGAVATMEEEPTERQPLGGSSAAPGISRRKAERFPVSAKVEFEPQGARGTRRVATLADVSVGGAGMYGDRPVGAGETVVLHLPFGGEQTVPVAGRVQYAKLAKDGRFRIGVRFITWAEADAEARAMALVSRGDGDAPPKTAVASASTGGGSDRREPRVRRSGPAVVQPADGKPGAKPLHAEMADVSASGVGFVCQSPMEVGQPCVVRFHGDDGRLQERQCKVVHCRPIDSGFRIGAMSARSVLGRLSRWFG